MNDQVEVVDDAEEAQIDAAVVINQPPLTRDEIRAVLLGKTPLAKSKLITVFGVEIELRQPTLASIMTTREIEDPKVRATEMIIKYAYVPGTEEYVFENTDREMILRWPFGEDLLLLQQTITDLTGLDIDAAKEDLEENPLDE